MFSYLQISADAAAPPSDAGPTRVIRSLHLTRAQKYGICNVFFVYFICCLDFCIVFVNFIALLADKKLRGAIIVRP